MFLFMFNFLLAIIIESYTKVREQLDQTPVEKNFFVDVYYIIAYTVKKLLYRFPTHGQILKHIELEVEDDGTFHLEKDLKVLFPQPGALAKFREHYSKSSFGFLYKTE